MIHREAGAAVGIVRGVMDDFARRTGLDSEGPSTRYLWTDAHAVCAWLSLHAATGEERYLERALSLVDEVHRVLGRHRPDDARTGWISGLDEEEGAEHPTAGGLRIGKPLPERSRGEPPHPEEEWDRDGQYYHYLTRWMHALHRVARVTGEGRYHRWAVELAKAAHEGFVVADRGGGARMVWKASIDLSRSLVSSMGQHDPLDGWVTLLALRALPVGDAPSLDDELAELSSMCEGRSWATRDPLGIGGLLLDCWRLGDLVLEGAVDEEERLLRICREAWLSLEAFGRGFDEARPAATRLAFRELGLSLGLHAGERLADRVRAAGAVSDDLAARAEAIASWAPLADSIEALWLRPGSRRAETWTGHEDINAVSLATSLAPEGYLGA